jgi:hypothetical protein
MHIRKFLTSSFMFAALAGSGAVAHADIVQADFQEILGLPGSFISKGPRIEQLTGVTLPTASPQLTAADTISNPSNWANSLNVSFNPTTDILSLTGDGGNDYQTITVTLSNLVFDTPGQAVVGIVPISVGNAVFSSGFPFTTAPSFSADSFSVAYSVDDLSTFPPEFSIGPGTDTFRVELGSAVPEPSSIILLATLFVGLIIAARVSRVKAYSPSARTTS